MKLSRIAARLELCLNLNGIGPGLFMVLHSGFLSSSLFGAAAMDSLASFSERSYLLHCVVTLLVPLLIAHLLLASRKLPNTARQQTAFMGC